jgi:hypothetical protein
MWFRPAGAFQTRGITAGAAQVRALQYGTPQNIPVAGKQRQHLEFDIRQSNIPVARPEGAVCLPTKNRGSAWTVRLLSFAASR